MGDAERRERLRRAFGYCCGYCGVHEDECGGRLEEDHYQPRSQGGSDVPGNLVYCCPTCNRLKGSFWNHDVDSPRQILHPQSDDLALHMQVGPDGRLQPLTETGEFHIRRLRLNRAQLITLRSRRRRLATLMQDHQQLRHEFRRLQHAHRQVMALLREALEGDKEAMRQLRQWLDRGER